MWKGFEKQPKEERAIHLSHYVDRLVRLYWGFPKDVGERDSTEIDESNEQEGESGCAIEFHRLPTSNEQFYNGDEEQTTGDSEGPRSRFAMSLHIANSIETRTSVIKALMNLCKWNDDECRELDARLPRRAIDVGSSRDLSKIHLHETDGYESSQEYVSQPLLGELSDLQD
jgi:hypothetical protein